MTAFKALPPWMDFAKGRKSEMLRMRQNFVARLEKMHERTLREHSDLTTPEAEQHAHDAWSPPAPVVVAVATRRCAACDSLA